MLGERSTMSGHLMSVTRGAASLDKVHLDGRATGISSVAVQNRPSVAIWRSVACHREMRDQLTNSEML